MKQGRVAEWLGRGLQNLVQRFESARDLQYQKHPKQWDAFFIPPILKTFRLKKGNKKRRLFSRRFLYY